MTSISILHRDGKEQAAAAAKRESECSNESNHDDFHGILKNSKISRALPVWALDWARTIRKIHVG
jgi:hypothetical protein